MKKFRKEKTLTGQGSVYLNSPDVKVGLVLTKKHEQMKTLLFSKSAGIQASSIAVTQRFTES